MGATRRALRTSSLVAAAVIVAASCGGGSSKAAKTPGSSVGGLTSTTSPLGSGSSSTKTTMGKPVGSKVRIVNLFATSSGSGPALDVYDIVNPKKDDEPLISHLEYGQASDVVEPRAPQYGDTANLEYFVAGTKDPKDPKNTDLNLGSYPPASLAKGDVSDTIVFAGEPSGGKVTANWADFVEAGPDANTQMNAVGPEPGQATLVVNSQALPSSVTSANTHLFLGANGTCPRALNAQVSNSTTVPAALGNQLAFGFAPGSTTVGVYATTLDQPDCSGTPVASATIDLGAGNSVIMWLYGTGPSDIHVVSAPAIGHLPPVTTTTSG